MLDDLSDTQDHRPWRGTRPLRLDAVTHLTPLVRASGLADPRELYDELEAQWGEVAPVELEPGVPAWLVMGQRLVYDIMRNEHVFATDPQLWNGHARGGLSRTSGLRPVLTSHQRFSANHADGALRQRLRVPLDDAFEQLSEPLTAAKVRSFCNLLIDRFEDRGRADLMLEYASVIPLLVVADMIGLDPEDGQRLFDLTRRMAGGGTDSADAVHEMDRMLGDLVAVRREHPRRDLASSLVAHPNMRDDVEVTHTLLAVAYSGNLTLTAWVAQTLLLTLADARFSGRLHGGRIDLDSAMDEVLWRSTPTIHSLPRFARQDVVLDDKLVAAGDPLVLAIHAANTDPRMDTGDPWDHVGSRAHVSFGTGPHACPAPRTARVIARIAVETVLRRLEVVLRIPAADVTWDRSLWMRQPVSIPVTFPVRVEKATPAEQA
ncbi:cytochrome P450 [Promicromonospora sp. MEB111]|uniref:cytochrome P450 n=1 Tax=Promicromonospora sp. MEB111 TaxID=3040301 RepID=UPI0025511FBB|nr:cytochrome P450 [Promicromonospora sp. MEB111]